MLLAASQHSDDPPEQDDGHGHAHEAGRHPPQICRQSTSSTAAHQEIQSNMVPVANGLLFLVIRPTWDDVVLHVTLL